VIYLSGSSASLDHAPPWFGLMNSAGRSSKKPLRDGRLWALDNGVYTGVFTPERYIKALESLQPWRDTCLFAVAPDVIADAAATRELFEEWRSPITGYGYKVAYVAQDGQEALELPAQYDVLFIGGSTDWKLGPGADDCIRQAKAAGKWVHMGRVNSQRRIVHAQLRGVDSCDGTYAAFNPPVMLRRFSPVLRQGHLLEVL
jgi:hypothetical protein